ncbi:hypothetical protein BDV06DRAFT_232121 [Aspergillus oleicola]
MSVHKYTKPSTRPSRTRRQNHACDQCRKSKRACDGVSGQRLSCSYCSKTKKRCTTEWATSRAQILSEPTLRDNILDSLSPVNLFQWLSPDPEACQGNDNLEDLTQLQVTSTQELMAWPPIDLDLSGSLLAYDLLSPDKQEFAKSDVLSSSATLFDSLSQDINELNVPTQHTLGLELSPSDNQGSILEEPESIMSALTYNDYDFPVPVTSEAANETWMFQQQPSYLQSRPVSLSPFSMQQQMINTFDNQRTSENLLRIYHDVLEHNLSCWLSETTCPYQLGPPNDHRIIPEWGSSWSNRIYHKTIKLDRVAQSCGLVQLTHHDDQAASKALHLAIMAFATQWAQGSRRHRERYNSQSPNGSTKESLDEFDRILQSNLWEQARRALQEVAQLDSYRVACAEIIMGLAQRPWTSEDQAQAFASGQQEDSFSMDSLMSQVRDIIDKDGPPKYMESAARRMHALKYRYDTLTKGSNRKSNSDSTNFSHVANFSSDDRCTIGLLYWLAIMFDTVSSSMNERPVVVLDEDCPHQSPGGSQEKENKNSPASSDNTRWDLDLFVQGGLKGTNRTNWPCSYEVAAEDVVRSAPVKVLLFRHLSYLQNALRKGMTRSQIENIIGSTLSLYKYWNRTHGAFFADMIKDHQSVPRRIQGWFVVISGHWHLAAMMLADLLDIVDENTLGTEDGATARKACQFAQRMRMDSARGLADLARIATPDTADVALGMPQMPGFHHAVNEGTLLTEPWTIILIRAFSKACVIFLSDARVSLSILGHSMDYEEYVGRAESCIKGMWLLGKKSDMARKIAETLSSALSILRSTVH